MPWDTSLLRGKTILIADDDPLILELYGKKIETLGAKAVTAIDGEDTLLKLGQENVDAILLDIRMPKMNGYEVLRKIKEDPRTKDIPVLIFTSLESHPEYPEKVIGVKVEEFIIKSNVLPDDVMQKIASHLKK
jgi:CheY-like chemotaxis protein